jgi:hypothetical protein
LLPNRRGWLLATALGKKPPPTLLLLLLAAGA